MALDLDESVASVGAASERAADGKDADVAAAAAVEPARAGTAAPPAATMWAYC